MKEIIRTGVDPFALVSPVVNRCFYTNRATMPKAHKERITHCYELEYIPWGAGKILTDGVETPAVEGTVFFRRPGMLVHGFPPYTSYGILMDSFPMEELPLFCRFKSPSAIASYFEEANMHYFSDDPLSLLKVKSAILNIMYLMMDWERRESSKKKVSVQLHLTELEALKAYIEENLDKSLTLEELAKRCNTSQGYLCRLFREAYLETLFSYMKKRRVNRAKTMLIETNMLIKDVCVSCGFDNESYFYRTFKASTHMSPNDFRNLHRAEGLMQEERE